MWCRHHAISGWWSNFHSQTLSQKKSENGMYTHSFNWDNSATSCDANMTRYSAERSAQVPDPGGAARVSYPQLGAPFSNSVRWEGSTPGVDIDHTDISIHFNPSSKRRVSGCQVAWFMAGEYHAHAIRGRCDIGAISSLMVQFIIWAQESTLLFFVSVPWKMVVGARECIARMRR